MTTTILREHGQYGAPIAAVVDGETITAPPIYAVHQIIEGEATIVYQSDPRESPRWQQLIDDGTLTPEMLTPVPEPVAAVFERLRQEKIRQLNAWFGATEAAGWPIPNTDAVQRLSLGLEDGKNYKSAIDLQQLRIELDRVTRAAARVTWVSMELQQIVCTVAQAQEWIADYGESREQMTKDYLIAFAQIEAATTVEELNAITFGTSP